MTGDLIFYYYNGNATPYKQISYTRLDAESYMGVHMGKDFVGSLKAPAATKDDITNVSRTEHGTRFKHIVGQDGNAFKAERNVTLNLSIHGRSVAEYNTNFNRLMEILNRGHFAVEVPSRQTGIVFLKYVSSQSYAESRNGCNSKLAIKCIEYNPSKRAFES